MNIDETSPQEEAPAPKTYTVLFAEDIPHYASAEIEATDDADALLVARALDTSGLCYEAYWDGSVCKRIVNMEDASGSAIANDIPLDDYSLRSGGDADRLLCDAAADLLELARYADQMLSDFTPEALRSLGLDALLEQSRSALAKATPN